MNILAFEIVPGYNGNYYYSIFSIFISTDFYIRFFFYSMFQLAELRESHYYTSLVE